MQNVKGLTKQLATAKSARQRAEITSAIEFMRSKSIERIENAKLKNIYCPQSKEIADNAARGFGNVNNGGYQ